MADIWAMVLRGCSVIIMVVWYTALTNAEFVYLPGVGHNGLIEVQVLYALSATYLGTLLSTFLEKKEASLKLMSPVRPFSEATWKSIVNTVVGLSDILQVTLHWNPVALHRTPPAHYHGVRSGPSGVLLGLTAGC